MKVEELTRRFVWLLVVAAVVRLGCVVFVPLELIPDEAYYWDWSRRLDWCYYSKPPMVAWLIGATTRMLGSYEWSVRLPAAVLNIVTLSVVWALGKRMYGGRVAWLGALAFLAVPGASVSGLLMTIDAPLLSFWAFGLLSVWEALNTRGARSVVWWWAAGMAGAGGVLSKQMMLVFPALTVLYCLVSGEKRRVLREMGIYVFLGWVLVALVPLIWWNVRHEWVTFQHTGSHFRGGGEVWSWVLNPLYLIGTQALMISPVLWVICVVTGVRGLRMWRKLDERGRFLLMYSLVPLSIVAILSVRQRILPNWPAAFYLAGSVYGAAWAAGEIELGAGVDRWRRWFIPGVVVGLVMAVGAILGLAIIGQARVGEGVLRKRLWGWRELAHTVDSIYRGLPNASNTFIMGMRDRSITSALAFYLPGQPRTYEWTYDVVVKSQYGIWQRSFDKVGWDALLVMHARDRFVPQTNRFRAITLVGEHCDQRGEALFRVYLARELREWPDLYYHLPEELRARQKGRGGSKGGPTVH